MAGRSASHHAGPEIACHDKRLGRRERCVDRAHLHGILPSRPGPANDIEATAATMLPGIELLRFLAEYEQVARGGW